MNDVNLRTDLSDSHTETRLATTSEDRYAAYRLRYALYIAEQGKPYAEADHDLRILTDELDDDGEVIVVKSDGAICGTVRANWFDSAKTWGRYGKLFALSRFARVSLAEIAVCSRLAASPEHRHARAPEKLFEAIYERGLKRHTKLCFVTCAPVLRRMFRKYGFREYLAPIDDPVVGPLHRLVLVLSDLEYLAKCGSPFIRIATEHALIPNSHVWLTEMFESYGAQYASA
jgi:predicted GNAT family N-acyltransferase